MSLVGIGAVQGSVPLPHPPYPLVSLLIWCYTDFSKENGGAFCHRPDVLALHVHRAPLGCGCA
jgi:hypothetical protein